VLEVVRPSASAIGAQVAIFDFDGTISLIRSGWMEIMVPLCVEQLESLGSGETRVQLETVVEEFVWRLTGKETIYQMMALAAAIEERGGTPLEPLAYKKMYLDRLWLKIEDRIEGLRNGTVDPGRFLVPGTVAALRSLVGRGLTLYLASGTDDRNVKEEAELLGVSRFFPGRIFGAQDDLKSFSKALLVQQLVRDANDKQASRLLVFGDGFVEIEEVHKVGGTAVGLATNEPECSTVDQWKRERLMAAGADFIIPNFLNFQELSSQLFSETTNIKETVQEGIEK
jgi:phosphoglycolate phosphatase